MFVDWIYIFTLAPMFDEKKRLANVISQQQKDSSLQLIQNDDMKNSKGRSEAVFHIPKVATNTQTKQSQILRFPLHRDQT